MTQEEKDLLLRDLCGRLPYGVKIYTTLYGAIHLNEIMLMNFRKGVENALTPYLRPMSSMTEEELSFYNNHLITPGITILEENLSEYLDWMHSHHFDYRGLIEKGLALEAPEGMYKMEE